MGIGADKRGRKSLTHDLRVKGGPSRGPRTDDGLHTGANDNGFFQIYVKGAVGRNPTRLTHNREYHWLPAWSPDGQTIAYYTYTKDALDGAMIHLMTADGQYLKQLGDVHDGHDFQPDISPLGLAVSPTSTTTTTWGRLKKSASNVR